MSKIAPLAIYLPDGQIILAEYTKNGEYRLHGFDNHVLLSGSYADALSALIEGSINEHEQKRLQSLEKHDWLTGLSCASLTPTITPEKKLIGSELGMLFVELTDRCNEKCIHCYADSSPDRTDFLPLEKIKSLLKQAAGYGTPYLQFTGGDPLIHPHLLEAVEYASTLPFNGIEIYTNGLLLNDKLLKKLTPFKPALSFSIYADCAEIHDAITRVPGSWKKTVDAMKRAKDNGFNIRAGVVLMQENIHCAENMPPFLKRKLNMEPHQIRFDAVNQVGRGRELAMIEGIIPSHTPSSGSKRKGKLCIAANGDVFPCVFARNFKLGSIMNQSLQDIFSAMRHKNSDASDSQRWNSCRDQLSCGDCRIIAYTTEGESL